MKHLKILIEGRVQGVSYRRNAQNQAVQLGLVGYAKNLADGRVEIEVEGSEAALDKFVEWCKSNPGESAVTKIEVVPGHLKGHSGFERY